MNLEQETEAINAVSRAVDRVKRVGRGAEFQLSNGIILRIKSVPPFLYQAVQNEFKAPPPPKVFIEEKGREEENPNDPEYIRLLIELDEQQSLAINDLFLAAGTEIISVPEGYYLPEEDGWIASVEFAQNITGKELRIDRENPIKRYLHWLRFYALETGADIALATRLPMELGGIREGEVEEVMESFRGLPQRGTDTSSEATTGNSNGHTANRAARRSRS